MRVLHLATTYPLHADDSSAAFVQSIAEGLAARGHTIDMVVPWHPELETSRPETAVRLVAFRYSPSRRWHPWGYAQALTGDRRLRPDAYLAAPLAAWSAWRTLRALERRSPYDIVHAHWLIPNAPIVAAAARRGTPTLISCHGSGVFMAERRGWARRAARYALDRAAAVTACSGELARRVTAIGGPPARRIPYGVDVDRFRPLADDARQEARRRLQERFGIESSAPLVLAVGRLVYKKGFDVLVGAWSTVRESLPEARLLIVGSGPLGGALRTQAREAGVGDALVLGGALPHAELPEVYGAADLVAVPSVHGPAGNVDGLPNTLVEGLSSGTPVVASAVAGIPDVVTDGVNGILCPEGDRAAFGAAITGLLRDRDRARAIGARARAIAEREMGWDRVAERFEALYEEIG